MYEIHPVVGGWGILAAHGLDLPVFMVKMDHYRDLLFVNRGCRSRVPY